MVRSFAHQAQEITYRKVADYLTHSDLFKDAMRAVSDRPKFDLLYGSTMVEVEVLSWDVHPWDEGDLAIVKACSCVTYGSRVDADLMRYLLAENCRMRFGAFQLDDQQQVLFSESVLGGDGMDIMELQTCILAVATIADTYDDILVEKFGGNRACDRPTVEI